jgi:hypothetical protein
MYVYVKHHMYMPRFLFCPGTHRFETHGIIMRTEMMRSEFLK